MGKKRAAKIIHIRCEAPAFVEPAEVLPLQGGLKKLSVEDRQRLRRSIEEYGLRFPHFVWRHPESGKVYSVDGHQRTAIVLEMLGRGYTLEGGKLPVVFISAKDETEAKRLVLLAASQYARVDEEGFSEFLRSIEASALSAKEMLDLTSFPDVDMSLVSAGIPGLSQLLGLEEDNEPRTTLAERFLVPPFSVLDSRQGYWQERKRAWLALGIESEVGRGTNLLNFSDTVLFQRFKDPKSKRGALEASTLTMKGPQFYDMKTEAELMLGKKLTTKEFLRDHYVPPKAPLQSGYTGTSVFDPVLCELAYTWFTLPGFSVLDPFAGGSVRGIVASRLGRKYLGIDLSSKQLTENRRQEQKIRRKNDPRPSWEEGNSLKVLEKMKAGKKRFDFVFSCPPYYDLEVYSKDKEDISTLSSYGEFLEQYNAIIAAALALLKPNRFACFVVGDIRDEEGFYRNFISDTVSAFVRTGARLYNEAILVSPVGSLPIRIGKAFGSYRKLGKTHQNVLIFYKGNEGKSIEKEFGKIVFVEKEEL